MKKRRRNKSSQGKVPQVPIGPNDLEAIETILSGTMNYFRNSIPFSSQTATKIHVLEDLHQRIQFLRHSGDGTIILISQEDFLLIREAIQTFVQLIRRLVPSSPERDETLKRVNRLRRHLEMNLLTGKDRGTT